MWLERTRRRYRFVVLGFVVMPEHMHLLMSEPDKHSPSRAMQALKLSFARRVLAEQKRRRNPRQSDLFGQVPRHIWQARFYDFNVWTERKRIEKLRYIHRNPVKRGLVASPEMWRWSSYRYYAFGERGIVEVNGWEVLTMKVRVPEPPRLENRETWGTPNYETATRHELDFSPLNRTERVQSHDMLYKTSRDILYTPALARPAGEVIGWCPQGCAQARAEDGSATVGLAPTYGAIRIRFRIQFEN
jgi:putative transposase